MTKWSGEYRAQAAELHAQARLEPNPRLKASLEKLAQGYIHLAELAERGRRGTMAGAGSNLQGEGEFR